MMFVGVSHAEGMTRCEGDPMLQLVALTVVLQKLQKGCQAVLHEY